MWGLYWICVVRHSVRHNFVSAQYLENKMTEFYQIYIYAFILTWSSLGLLHVIFRIFVPELWPLIYAKILFPLNILFVLFSTDMAQGEINGPPIK